MTTTPVMDAQRLFVDYRLGRRWFNALYEVSLTINPLQIHGLVGESGSGKSTLGLAMMRYLAANARISSGKILLDGEDLVPKSDAELRGIWGSKLSYVPQNPLASLNPSYTMGDQISEVVLRHQNLSRQEALAQSVEILRRVKISDPEIVARRYPHQLSGGMLQRVTIAMALSTQPRLLVLDEPTTALDVTTQAVILDLFRELIRTNKAAALYVSHDLGTVAQLCDHVTVLYGGEVMESASVRDIYHRPIHPYTAGLLMSLPKPFAQGDETRLPTIEGVAPALTDRPHGCVFVHRCPVALEICHREKPPLDAVPLTPQVTQTPPLHQVGLAGEVRLVRCHRWEEIASGELSLHSAPQPALPTAPPREGYVLEANNIRKEFNETGFLDRLMGKPNKSVRAVDDVSINLNARSTLGIVGESGSGKTTLARAIVALDPADSGEMELLNLPLKMELNQRAKDQLCNLQMVFQNPNDTLNPYRSIGQTLGRTVRLLDGRQKTRAALRERVLELLRAVRLPETYADRYPGELSGGEKQRVAIARAFAAYPAVVIADEPTSSLDVSVQAVVLNLLKDLRAKEGASYVLISHDLDVIAYLADRIVVMYLGEIMEVGTTAQVYDIPSHPYTEALISAIPVPDPDAPQGAIRLEGDVPSARNKPTGCPFHTRCPRKIGKICEETSPPWQDAGEGHRILCHIPVDELIELQSKTMIKIEG
jgi:peptide/nickel transport system ATP-binding protein